jgi:hypothetical protein
MKMFELLTVDTPLLFEVEVPKFTEKLLLPPRVYPPDLMFKLDTN